MVDDFVVCFENEVKAIGFGGSFEFTARPDSRMFASARNPGAAGIFSNITNKSRGKLGGRDQSKMVNEILPLRDEPAGQLLGYRHHAGQNETIADAYIRLRLSTSAPMTTSRHPVQFPLKLAHIFSSCSELDHVIEERTVSFHDRVYPPG